MVAVDINQDLFTCLSSMKKTEPQKETFYAHHNFSCKISITKHLNQYIVVTVDGIDLDAL